MGYRRPGMWGVFSKNPAWLLPIVCAVGEAEPFGRKNTGVSHLSPPRGHSTKIERMQEAEERRGHRCGSGWVLIIMTFS